MILVQPDALFYLVGGIAVIILGLSKGGFAGIGMISTPLLTLIIGHAATNVMKAPAFIALGQLSVGQLKTTLILLPLAIVSSWAGVRLVQMIDVRKFNTAITMILLGVSMTLVCQGVAGFREL
jgi:hypothetical protein